jgi:hypothetical protein
VATDSSGDIPESWWVKGADQFGIYQRPVTSTSNAGLIVYQRRIRKMTQDDYTTGTVQVTANSAAVVGSGTTWTAQMVGRTLIVEDGGSQEGVGYKVSAFTDATNVTLENTYAGLSGTGKSYRIGEAPDIPEEYHENLIDYALFRYYLKRKDRGMIRDMKALVDNAIEECKAAYASNTTSNYGRSRRNRRLGAFTRSPNVITGS